MRSLRGVGTPALGMICLLLIPLALSATTTTSFETGFPAGWSLIGAGGYCGPFTNFEPTDGSHFGWITTAGGTDGEETGDSHEHEIVPGHGFGLSHGVHLNPGEEEFDGHSIYLLDAGRHRLEFGVEDFDHCRPRVPEPSAAVLAGIGIVLIGLRRMRSRIKGMLAAGRGRR